MSSQHEALRLADELDRMYDQLDPVDDWRPVIDAAGEALRQIPRLEAARSSAVANWEAACRRVADLERVRGDSMLADAARFRWLGEVALIVDMVADPDNLVQVWHETLSGNATTGRTLREAVDEAMKQHN